MQWHLLGPLIVAVMPSVHVIIDLFSRDLSAAEQIEERRPVR
jgi:hypothetical protein